MKCFVVVPAAGSGSRFGGEVPKQFVSLAGRPLIARTLAMLESFDSVAEIVVAASSDQFGRISTLLASEELRKVRVVEGGASRLESVLRGLNSLEGDAASIVAIHDAVRPFLSQELFDRLLRAAAENDGAFPGLPPTDTVHVIDKGFVVQSPSRERLAGAQTPQCFRLDIVRRALESAAQEGLAATDEVSAVVRMGYRVAMVEGEPDNFKITRPEDLERAERLLARRGE